MSTRTKKVTESKKSKKDHPIASIEDDAILEEVSEDETNLKKSKKSDKKAKKDSEDELSDLDLDKINGAETENPFDAKPKSSFKYDPVVPMNHDDSKPIDGNTPIKDLSIHDGLMFYHQLGKKSFNPELMNGAIELLNRLTCNNYTNNNMRSFNHRNNRSRNSNRSDNFLKRPNNDQFNRTDLRPLSSKSQNNDTRNH